MPIIRTTPQFDDIFTSLLKRPIAFHRAFADIAGGALPGLFLSQAYYWSKRTSDPQGWFYKTQQEWEEETALTRREQETARKHLRRVGILEEKREGLPAKMYYKINTEALYDGLVKNAQTSMAQNAKQEWRKTPNRNGAKRQTIPETTTEITTETTKAKTPPLSPKGEMSASFNHFWSLYPVKKARQKAWVAWHKGKLDPLQAVIEASVLEHMTRDEDWSRGAIPHPATFLNQQRWTDDLTPSVLPGQQLGKAAMTTALGSLQVMADLAREREERHSGRPRVPELHADTYEDERLF